MRKKKLALLQKRVVFIATLATFLFTQTLKAQVCDRSYVCYPVSEQFTIDGKLDEPGWNSVRSSEEFVNILGRPYSCADSAVRFKMTYDSEFLYIGAEVKEKSIWAKHEKSGPNLFTDNAFEIFIDPNGNTHNYMEFQVNAMGTLAVLTLSMPYRDGNPKVKILKNTDVLSEVHVYGTLNNPMDVDSSWTVEMAIPWKLIKKYTTIGEPLNKDTYRVNFATVRWHMETTAEGEIVKKMQEHKKWPVMPEYAAWSPQYEIDLHKPENWGYVKFTNNNSQNVEFNCTEEESIKWFLREIYYYQYTYYLNNGEYLTSIPAEVIAKIKDRFGNYIPIIKATKRKYKISVLSDYNSYWVIDQKGKIENKPGKI